ncbi:hypothetical protein COLO4_04308 [Corchorus olitorius]|uniref:Nucleic acid-binding protein n=1 Tax=Corchorus olitorius TaxID=93759 RepID=A0A1R3KUN7_9ROSI|nr:hypothetical protein COLO4_04308 [Corchorus olitorius]
MLELPSPEEYTIYFSSSTKLTEDTENLEIYPKYFFRFAEMADIMKRSEKDPPLAVLVDSGTRTSHKVDVNLRLLSDDILRVSFWVSHIQHHNLAELAAMAEKPIFAVASTTVSSSSAKVYVNPDIREAQEIRQSNCPLKVHPTKGGGFECTQQGLVTPRLVMQLTLMIKDETVDDFEVVVFGPLAKNLMKQQRQALPASLKGTQIIGSASDVELPAAANLPQPLLAVDDSQTCLDSPSIPFDLFAEILLVEEEQIKQGPIPKEESKKQDESHSGAQPQQKILPRESKVKQVARKLVKDRPS